MTTEGPIANGQNQLDLLAVYKETWLNVRETDQISLKLLGLVPTVATSGAAVLGFLLHDHPLPLPAAIVLSGAGAFATFAIFLWERRSIETCRWLIRRLGQLERAANLTLEPPPPAPTMFGYRAGKGEAKRLIYAARLLFGLSHWLSLCGQPENEFKILIPTACGGLTSR